MYYDSKNYILYFFLYKMKFRVVNILLLFIGKIKK